MDICILTQGELEAQFSEVKQKRQALWDKGCPRDADRRKYWVAQIDEYVAELHQIYQELKRRGARQ